MDKSTDLYFMNEAYKEAQKAYDILEAPIGAVIVADGVIIGKGHNSKERDSDPTAHAEVLAIKEAARNLESWRLSDCDMYVTLEPCTMCAGAIIQARINRIFIGTKDPKAGAAGSVFNILNSERLNHRVKVNYGIMEEESSKILKKFFKGLRNGTIKKLGKKSKL